MVIVLLADGFEELEALSPIDVLRRSGIEVRSVGIADRVVSGAHGIKVVADLLPEEVIFDEVDCVVFPGGMPGSLNLDASPFSDKAIEEVTKRGGHLAAICAAPLVFGRRGLLEGKKATCFPGFESELKGAAVTGECVVTDGNITTARDFKCAVAFGERLAEIISKKEVVSLELPVVSTTDIIRTEEPVQNCSNYQKPPIELLGLDQEPDDEMVIKEIQENIRIIIDTLASFNVTVSVKGVDRGPRVTRYEIVPSGKAKIQSVTKLFDVLAFNLSASNLRMEAPIPDRESIGLEIPNKYTSNVRLRELLEQDEYVNAESDTFICIGKDVVGNPVFSDIAKLPHALIAGAAGAGKSVLINSIILSLLYKANPDKVKLILIDTKNVEFKKYDGIPHLLTPILTDAKQAAGALTWAAEEMERRYDLMERIGARNIDSYNQRQADDSSVREYLPKVVIIIDELGDLMLQARDPAEDLIMIIAQKARAVGIHLIIGTQAPTPKILTATVKANIHSRISCKVSSVTHSRAILEMAGAEKLLSLADMLFKPVYKMNPIRVQGAYVSDSEVEDVVKYIRDNNNCKRYDEEVLDKIDRTLEKISNKKRGTSSSSKRSKKSKERKYFSDPKFLNAVEVVIRFKTAYDTLLQRKLSIGCGKSAEYLNYMEEIGVVGKHKGTQPRDVLITMEQWKEKLAQIDGE